MTEVLKLADQVAPSDASILITGASGTGKELMAKHIHSKSRRRDHRFVAVNCAAIPENLLESELFGHEKGAFTGAVARRIGKFEEANGGTLLLDEISEMEPRMQAKLLRAIQEREIDRVGGNKPVQVDVRIIATSNRDMEAEVAAGTFREDLYFRLNVVNLDPAAAARPARRHPQAGRALRPKKYAQANGVPALPMSEEAKAADPLRLARQRARAGEHIPPRGPAGQRPVHRPEAFGLTVRTQAGTAPAGDKAAPATGETGTVGLVGRTVSDVERDLIIDTLHHCLGNRTHAANILGISIRTLRNKLKQYVEQGFAVPMPGDGGRHSTVYLRNDD